MQGAEIPLQIGRGHPNGVLLATDFGNTVEAIEIPEGMEGFEDGEFVSGSLEMGLCYLTGDGVPELLLASGDNAALLTVAVFAYTATAEPRWNLVGMIEGRAPCSLQTAVCASPMAGRVCTTNTPSLQTACTRSCKNARRPRTFPTFLPLSRGRLGQHINVQ